ncbi:hypothetical protein ACQEU3_15045 [Spirillospora sp. CA-253888]
MTAKQDALVLPAPEFGRALEVVKAAYEEALRQHGMLSSTIVLISSYAEDNLAALADRDDP